MHQIDETDLPQGEMWRDLSVRERRQRLVAGREPCHRLSPRTDGGAMVCLRSEGGHGGPHVGVLQGQYYSWDYPATV